MHYKKILLLLGIAFPAFTKNIEFVRPIVQEFKKIKSCFCLSKKEAVVVSTGIGLMVAALALAHFVPEKKGELISRATQTDYVSNQNCGKVVLNNREEADRFVFWWFLHNQQFKNLMNQNGWLAFFRRLEAQKTSS